MASRPKVFFGARPTCWRFLCGPGRCAGGSSRMLPKSYPDGIQTEGLLRSPPYMLEVFVWSWSLCWWFVEDAAKVLPRWHPDRRSSSEPALHVGGFCVVLV